jgi:hypothetical protein
MRIATGKVISGKVVVEGEPLEEGSTVTVIAPENSEVFELSPEDEERLLASLAEATSGQVISGSELLRDLGHQG